MCIINQLGKESGTASPGVPFAFHNCGARKYQMARSLDVQLQSLKALDLITRSPDRKKSRYPEVRLARGQKSKSLDGQKSRWPYIDTWFYIYSIYFDSMNFQRGLSPLSLPPGMAPLSFTLAKKAWRMFFYTLGITSHVCLPIQLYV